MKMLASQQMRMSFAMQQAMHVMCSSQLELADYLTAQIDANPLLERRGMYLTLPEEGPSLYTHLMSQAAHSFKDLTAAENIIGSLDEKGFLTEQVSDLEILETIQTFDPLGVAAKDTRDSLLIQLRGQNKKQTLAYQLIEHHYDDLLHGRLPNNIEIKTAIAKDIRPLDPFPGLRFGKSPPLLSTHDLSVLHDETWKIEVNEDLLPSYERLPLEGVYYRKYIAAILWLERIIKRRRSMLEKLGAIIVKHHGAYLLGDEIGMKPLKMCDVATKLAVSESTVSRAVQSKTVLCPLGLKPLRFFFNTNHHAKELLKELIAHEIKPLSDEKLAQLLSEKGSPLARRTVAKYRKELGIMSARQRRPL